jgi:hypothetical protein
MDQVASEVAQGLGPLPVPAHDQDRYVYRYDMIPKRLPNGTAVAYSTDGDNGFAPLRGRAGCVSIAGRARQEHEFDRDGVCFWCCAKKRA